jgi:hypothetical protein
LASGPEHLDFGEMSGGWVKSGVRPDDYDWGIDCQLTRGGKPSGYIKFTASDVIGAGSLTQMFRADNYVGNGVRLSGYLNAVATTGPAVLQMRVDGWDYKQLSFEQRPIQNTNDWTKYELVLDVPPDAVKISSGVNMASKGQVWLNDLRLEVVGKDVPTNGP